MATWAYKATEKKAGPEFTKRLADRHRFLARTAYYPPRTLGAKAVKAAFAWDVAVGDTLLLYFGGKEKRLLGAYKVMDPARSGPGFKKVGKEGAFAEVKDAGLKAAFTSAPEYKPDPVFKNHVGFVLERLDGVEAPPFEAIPWPNQHTLIRLR